LSPVPASLQRAPGSCDIVSSADRADPREGSPLDPLLGAGGGELVAAGWAGGDPDAAEQVESWRRDGAGVAFSTSPDGWAQVWPGWLSEIALRFLFAVGLAAWICWAILARLRADNTAST
jgi:hypothetical protein